MEQIYSEAESNANEFALACSVRRSREDSDSRTRRAEQAVQAARVALPRREPYFRRSRISRKPRAMQMNLTCRKQNLREHQHGRYFFITYCISTNYKHWTYNELLQQQCYYMSAGASRLNLQRYNTLIYITLHKFNNL